MHYSRLSLLSCINGEIRLICLPNANKEIFIFITTHFNSLHFHGKKKKTVLQGVLWVDVNPEKIA